MTLLERLDEVRDSLESLEKQEPIDPERAGSECGGCGEHSGPTEDPPRHDSNCEVAHALDRLLEAREAVEQLVGALDSLVEDFGQGSVADLGGDELTAVKRLRDYKHGEDEETFKRERRVEAELVLVTRERDELRARLATAAAGITDGKERA